MKSGVVRTGDQRSVALKELATKRAALESLQADISRLERETGFRNRVQISARCVEIPAPIIAELGLPHGAVESGKAGFHVLSPAVAGRLHMEMGTGHELRTLAVASVVARNGEKAESFAGGQWPIPVPAPLSTARVQYRETGTKFEAIPRSLGGRRVQVDFQLSLSEADKAGKFRSGDLVIPAISETRVATTAELVYGETALFPLIQVTSTATGKPARTAPPQSFWSCRSTK